MGGSFELERTGIASAPRPQSCGVSFEAGYQDSKRKNSKPM